MEDRVDLPEHIKNEQSKSEMRVDEGVRERKWDFFDLTKGVLDVAMCSSHFSRLFGILMNASMESVWSRIAINVSL